jgi:fluoroquinolone transport system permease protein
LGWLLAALLLSNVVINTFYFVAGLVLLEKGEGTLEAQVVTPLRPGEYLAAKAITLTGLTLLENVLITTAVYGFNYHPGLLLAGLLLAALLFTWSGFIVVARYDAINSYLLPSILYTGLLGLPLIPYLAGWEFPLIYLHPLQAPLSLLEAAFRPVAAWEIGYGLAYGLLWSGITFAYSRRAFHRFVIRREGIRA